MGGFEERFSKVGKAIDDAKDKVRDRIEASKGSEPLVDTEKARERLGEWKQSLRERTEQGWQRYSQLPKATAAAVALGCLCVVLLITLVVMMNSNPGDAPPSRAKADEIATMAALRAKMSPTSTTPPKTGNAPKRQPR